MKRSTVIMGIVLAVIFGAQTATYAFNWKPLNVELISQSEKDSQITVLLKDKQGHTFKVIYQDEKMLEKLCPKIIKYKDEFFNWKTIRSNDITFMVFATFLDVAVIPQEIMHNNLNLASSIPAGITLTYDPDNDIMRYDFRMMKGSQFIHVPGTYFKETELVNKICTAYDNPDAFLQPANQEEMESGEVTGQQVTEKMVQALIYLNNEDWNGRHQTISVETIRKVVELRQKNPEVTKTQLWQMVKKEKLKITKRQMELILILYFNEYD